jgi:uncharacterized protein YutE (UPF0331/DUF86 family)
MNNYVVKEKLLKLKGYLDDLQTMKPISMEVYVRDHSLKYAVERVLQLIVDLALDINNMLLTQNKKPPAADYFNSFLDLAECGVLERDFALAIAPSTGLRNRLVHEYEQINHRIVYESIAQVISVYTDYLRKINAYIDN